jgi:hypothetical protein
MLLLSQKFIEQAWPIARALVMVLVDVVEYVVTEVNVVVEGGVMVVVV